METENLDKMSFATKIKLGAKIKMLNTFVARADEYYSITPPDPEWMVANGKKFWICPSSDNAEEVSNETNILSDNYCAKSTNNTDIIIESNDIIVENDEENNKEV